jgi:hypothetical protein
LGQTQQALEAAWQQAAIQNIKDSNWGDESWAK